jgi:aminopeptidase YwaD
LSNRGEYAAGSGLGEECACRLRLLKDLFGAMKKRFFPILLILIALAACRPAPGDSGQAQADGPPPIRLQPSGEELKRILSEHVYYLASDALGGREVGTPGINEAERYIAETFASLGLTPLPGREDFFLEFTLYRGGYDAEATTLEVGINGATLVARPGVDFRPLDFSAVGELQGQLVFAGYGITAPEYGYDDYDGLETEGKIVLLLRHEPQSPAGSQYFQGADLTRHSLFLTKAENAQAHGAAAMLLVTDPKSSTGAEDFRLQGSLALERGALNRYRSERQPIAALHISQPFAQKILECADLDLQALQGSLDEGRDPSRFQPGYMTVRLNVAMERTAEEVKARNVAAFLQGLDPLLRDEWILIGAHHDHLGSFTGEGDTVFNGADDNASGTAGILAVARILAELDPPPARSIVFATFSAEERGLFGSRKMASSQIQTDRIVLMVNLDMIGRNPDQPLQVMASSFSPYLRHLVEEANREQQLPLHFTSGTAAAVSDHDPFHRLGIPFLFFFTGMHEDYHGSEDEADRLSYSRLADVVRLVVDTVDLAAEITPSPGSTVYVDWLGMTAKIGGGQVLMSEEVQVLVTAVDRGAAAELEGLREGDSLLEVAGRIPSSGQELSRIFEAVRPGQNLALTVRRGERELQFRVQRPYAGYLGVLVADVEEEWRFSNDLEVKSGVLIRQVLEDGPAKQAGLQPGDVLVAVDGTSVGPMNLRPLLARIGAGVKVELTIVREGERLSLPVVLGRRP